MEKLLKVNEVAAKMGVARSTVYRFKDDQGLPFLKIGNSLRFEEEKVNEWIKEQNKDVLK